MSDPLTQLSENPTHFAPREWGLGTALGSFGLAFAIYVVGDTVLAVLASAVYRKDVIVFSILSYQFLAVGVGVCVTWLLVQRLHVKLSDIGFRTPTVPAILTALGSLLPIFVGVALLTAAFSTFFPSYHLQGNAKQELPVGHHVGSVRAGLILVWAAIEAPLVEEILFRGIIFQGLVHTVGKRFGRHLSVFLGALMSGCIFGLAHFEPHTLPILVFLGVALAYVFYYTRSLYASMLVHGAVNAIAAVSVMHGA